MKISNAGGVSNRAGWGGEKSVAADVLAMVMGAAAWLAERRAPISAPGIVSAVCRGHGIEAAKTVREHFIEAGLYPVKVV